MGGKDQDPDPWKRDVKKHTAAPNNSKSGDSVARSTETGRYVSSSKAMRNSGASAEERTKKDPSERALGKSVKNPGGGRQGKSVKNPGSRKPKEGQQVAKNDEDRYVVKHNDGWAVKKENAERASGVFNTQKEAIDRAREIVEKSGGGRGEIRIQGRDGKFRDSDSGSKNETRAKDTK